MTSDINRGADGTPTPGRIAPAWSGDALRKIKMVPISGGRLGLKWGKWEVDQDTVCKAWLLFWGSAHMLDKSKSHTAKELACTPEWEVRPDGWKRAMGRCYKYFALERVLPITIANPGAAYNFKYRLNADLNSRPLTP